MYFVKKIIVNILLILVPVSRYRKLIRYKLLGDAFPQEFFYKIWKKKITYGIKHIYIGQDGADVIYNELSKNKPSLITRIGTVEVLILKQFLDNKNAIINFENKEAMSKNAGFFPVTNYMLSRFSSETLEILRDVDILGTWFSDEEQKAVCNYIPDNVRIIDKECLGDLIFKIPWTRYLKGKKVLVIHPFAETIKSQYRKRELLFNNPDVLPEFDLQVIKAVQSIADEEVSFSTWFEALECMKKQIRQTNFDIALIGCGAYGMFLAHYCKELGKKAVHMGGATQILFGIKGKRWNGESFYNEHWVSPSENERPKGFEKVEDGCYW